MRVPGAIIYLLTTCSLPIAAQSPVPVSGYDFLGKDIQAIQDDEFLNPGMPTAELGRQIFMESEDGEKSCASCHEEGGEVLDNGKIASYPAYQPVYEKVHTLQERIHACWTDKQDRFPLLYDDPKLLALETYVRSLARGTVINVIVDDNVRPLYEKGEKLYKQRFGQMAMTCYHCHVQYQGVFMRGRKLTQGQTNGFPVYRFTSDQVTSLHKRFNECFVELRAEPYEVGSEEYRV